MTVERKPDVLIVATIRIKNSALGAEFYNDPAFLESSNGDLHVVLSSTDEIDMQAYDLVVSND